jgi:hypothetical protein
VILTACVAACGSTLTPTDHPQASLPASLVPIAAPTVAVITECGHTTFSRPALLSCDEALTAALASLPPGRQIAKAAFSYHPPCLPEGASCPFAGRGDKGFVILTPVGGEVELIRVQKSPGGTLTVSRPQLFLTSP